ncbi:MAG: T9SS type A sorting domain-containing protein [Bacteroidota bacterium]
MKRIEAVLIFLILLIAGTGELSAQNGSVAAGGNAISSDGSVSFSIGETNYVNAVGSAGSTTQGLQQPYEIYTVGTDNFKNINLEISAYPNPTKSSVNLIIEDQDLTKLSYQLYDLEGTLLHIHGMIGNINVIPMKDLPSAIYILRVCKDKTELKSFKIIKN